MSIWVLDGGVLRATQDTPDSPSFVPASPATAVSLDAFDNRSLSPMGLDDSIVACMQTVSTEDPEHYNPADTPSKHRESCRPSISSCEHSRYPSASAGELGLDDQLVHPVYSREVEIQPAWWKRTRHDVALSGTY